MTTFRRRKPLGRRYAGRFALKRRLDGPKAGIKDAQREGKKGVERKKCRQCFSKGGRLWYNRGVLNRDDRRNLVEITNVLPN